MALQLRLMRAKGGRRAQYAARLRKTNPSKDGRFQAFFARKHPPIKDFANPARAPRAVELGAQCANRRAVCD